MLELRDLVDDGSVRALGSGRGLRYREGTYRTVGSKGGTRAASIVAPPDARSNTYRIINGGVVASDER